ncbi:MAG: class D sortase [Oscillospiraceae bacterium]|nr:class D sortase [Oscillospiraceae bacterium]
MKNRNVIFSNWKKLLLPVAFGVCSAGLLTLALLPVTASVAAAADTGGYHAAPSPEALFLQPAETEPDKEMVDLADTGGAPQEGELYGTVSVSGTAVACNLYYGDSKAELHAGAGTYMGAQIPGQNGVVLIGGHTSTYFRDLESAQLGADITVLTRYGEYHYKIIDMQIVEAEHFGEAQLAEMPPETLLLYSCYPFGQALLTPYRYMIYGEYVSGPSVMASTEGGT